MLMEMLPFGVMGGQVVLATMVGVMVMGGLLFVKFTLLDWVQPFAPGHGHGVATGHHVVEVFGRGPVRPSVGVGRHATGHRDVDVAIAEAAVEGVVVRVMVGRLSVVTISVPTFEQELPVLTVTE